MQIPIIDGRESEVKTCSKCGSPFFLQCFRIVQTKSKINIGKMDYTPIPSLVCLHCNTWIGTEKEDQCPNNSSVPNVGRN